MPEPIVWKSRQQLEEEELERRRRALREMQERVAEESRPQSPFDVWEGLGRGVSGFLHTPDILTKPPRVQPTPYEDIPEASVGLPWTSPFTGEQARLGTKGAAEWIPDIVAFSGAPKSLGLKLWRAFPFKGVPAVEKFASVWARTVAAPIIATEEAPSLLKKGVERIIPSPLKTVMERAQALIPERTLTPDKEQLMAGHKAAYAKNLINKKTGNPTQTYRKLAQVYTGKTSMKQMTREEANTFIKAIGMLESKGGKPPKLPKTTALMDKEFWDKIPALKDVGIIDYLRQKPSVLKMLQMDDMADNLMKSELALMEEKQIFWKELASMETKVGKDLVRRERIFDAIENPIESHLLDPDEQGVFLYLKNFFDKWADDLAIPITERRKNYITHIFDKQLQLDDKQKRTLPLEILKALEFNYPKSTYMPFLKARLGKDVGLVKDPFKAAQVYESYALRDKYYAPFLQKLSAYTEMFQARGKLSTANYLKDMSRRIAGRPSKEDILINEDISKAAKGISKLIKGDAGLKLESLANRGNIGALIAYNMSSLYYTSWLGFRPVSAIRNLSQHLLAGADAGLGNLAKGIGLRFTPEGKAALQKSMVYRGRLLTEPVAGLEEDALRKLPKLFQDKALSMFKWADRQNVSDSFLAGYAKGKSLGMPESWAVRLGDEVAANTQYLYTRMARSLFEESIAGRFLTPFTSWTRNFTELFAKWAQGKPSAVIQQYMKETGKTVVEKKFSRAELVTYMALLSGAMAVEGATPIKATEYTGWTSIKNLGKFIGGDLPAWQVPYGIALLVTGVMGGDERQSKEGWSKIRQIYPLIISQLEDIAEGKQDLMSLFMYLDRFEMEAEESRQRPSRPSRERTSRERPSRRR